MKRFFRFKKKTVLPLSANPTLGNKENSAMDVYFDTLSSVFYEPRIKNIAISGEKGVGKSSLIKSYDVHMRKIIKKPKFLYVSLGSYRYVEKGSAQDEGSDQTDACCPICKWHDNFETDSTEINDVEQRILLQIISKACKREVPGSSLRLIPRRLSVIKKYLFGAYAAACISLLLKAPIVSFLLELLDMPCTIQNDECELISYISSGIHMSLQLIWDCRYIIESMVYIVAAMGTLYFIVSVFKHWYIKGNPFSKITTPHSEVEFHSNTPGDFLDRYAQELVYCLSCISNKIKHTVVFEDLERLDQNTAVHIFTKLRELNHLLNAHSKNQIRFIYVVDDTMIAKLQSEKFFDYILPVIATFNKESAVALFQYYFDQVNPICQSSPPSELINTAAPFLQDYRMMYAILNGYALTVQVYIKNNSSIDDTDIEKILAFQIYAHIWPDDYCNLMRGFPSAVTDDTIRAELKNTSKLLAYLMNRKLVTLDSLLYAGCSRESVMKYWINSLNTAQDPCNLTHNCMDPNNEVHVEAVKQYCTVQKGEEDISTEVLAAELQFIIDASLEKDMDHSWFFSNRTNTECLKALANLADSDCLGFIHSCHRTQEYGIFEKCCNKSTIVHNEWTFKMSYIFALGAPIGMMDDEVTINNGSKVSLKNLKEVNHCTV